MRSMKYRAIVVQNLSNEPSTFFYVNRCHLRVAESYMVALFTLLVATRIKRGSDVRIAVTSQQF